VTAAVKETCQSRYTYPEAIIPRSQQPMLLVIAAEEAIKSCRSTCYVCVGHLVYTHAQFVEDRSGSFRAPVAVLCRILN